MRPFLDKVAPEAWKAAGAFSIAIGKSALDRGLTSTESELIKVRTSQINACAFCLNLHTGEARDAGVPQQKLDMLAAWRETDLYDDREQAVLAIAEASAILPLTEEAKADLAGAQAVLGEDTFVAAEWVAVAINAFNRISILSEHPVRKRTE
ncbi:MAG: carboxymuconolactone decarboxylase family protein [Leucobacter sp.]